MGGEWSAPGGGGARRKKGFIREGKGNRVKKK